jgi:hypothetical protein
MRHLRNFDRLWFIEKKKSITSYEKQTKQT